MAECCGMLPKIYKENKNKVNEVSITIIGNKPTSCDTLSNIYFEIRSHDCAVSYARATLNNGIKKPSSECDPKQKIIDYIKNNCYNYVGYHEHKNIIKNVSKDLTINYVRICLFEFEDEHDASLVKLRFG